MSKSRRNKYLVLMRLPDGSWQCGGSWPKTLRQAQKDATFLRIMGGETTRTFPFAEHQRCPSCHSEEEIDEFFEDWNGVKH